MYLLHFLLHWSKPLQTCLASAPDVSLLLDFGRYNDTRSLKSLLPAVSMRKGQKFRLGFAYDPGESYTNDFLAVAKLSDTFNHGVAENFCKWSFTEPFEGVSDLTACKRAQSFFARNDADFRVAQLVWHIQLPPSWLPGLFDAEYLQDVILPRHIKAAASGMSDYVSVDVLNEIVADDVTSGDSALDCVLQKNTWPITRNDSSQLPLLRDLVWVEKSMQAAANSTTARKYLNDYNIGGSNPKTDCYYAIASHLKNRNIEFDGIGFQSHVSARRNGFDNKTIVKETFRKFAALGLDTPITEFDVWMTDDGIDSQRWQAAIYGDYLDACLYSPSCNEAVIWGLFDGNSWLNTYPGDYGIRKPLLFDESGTPKLNYYEIKARLINYIENQAEVCDTASGIEVCNLQTQSTQSSPNATTIEVSPAISTGIVSASMTSSTPSRSGAKLRSATRLWVYASLILAQILHILYSSHAL